jgi:hypothetical protein
MNRLSGLLDETRDSSTERCAVRATIRTDSKGSTARLNRQSLAVHLRFAPLQIRARTSEHPANG